jgi:cytochrome b involved in lipid metabolism
MPHRGPQRLRRLSAHVGAVRCPSPPPPTPSSDTLYTVAEVASHADRRSCWVVLRGGVYDFTPFLSQHPGGARGLLRHAGTDASEAFTELHSQSIFSLAAPYRIGRLAPTTAAPGANFSHRHPWPSGECFTPACIRYVFVA